MGGIKIAMALVASGLQSDDTMRTNSGSNSSGSGGLDISETPHVAAMGRNSVAGVGRGGVAGARGIMSPEVLSKAKRLLLGISNMDKSVEARKLAEQALHAFNSAL